MPKPLKNLETAKSGVFRAQGNQSLSKTHDFAGESFSFRFRFTRASLRFARNLEEGSAGAKNLESREKSFFRLATP
jgi:hypothetical protein